MLATLLGVEQIVHVLAIKVLTQSGFKQVTGSGQMRASQLCEKVHSAEDLVPDRVPLGGRGTMMPWAACLGDKSSQYCASNWLAHFDSVTYHCLCPLVCEKVHSEDLVPDRVPLGGGGRTMMHWAKSPSKMVTTVWPP